MISCELWQAGGSKFATSQMFEIPAVGTVIVRIEGWPGKSCLIGWYRIDAIEHITYDHSRLDGVPTEPEFENGPVQTNVRLYVTKTQEKKALAADKGWNR